MQNYTPLYPQNQGYNGYSMLLQTLQGKSILAHFSCPYALVVFKHHTIYRKTIALLIVFAAAL